MKSYPGHSSHADSAAAVAEITKDWPAADGIDVVFGFCSSTQDPEAFSAALAARAPGAVVVGCTTSGEHLEGAHYRDSAIATALSSPGVRWKSAVVQGLGAFDAEAAEATVSGLLSAHGITADDIDEKKHFCLMFIEGLTFHAEHVVQLMADALGGVPLLGGSAGDDLKFESTFVFNDGQALNDAVVFVFGESDTGFDVLKHQHFTANETGLVITKADPSTRTVYEINGFPALEAYAKAIGLAPEDVDIDASFMHPVVFTVNNQHYVRSIQAINQEDGSLAFYCAIDEGMVLDIGGHHDMATCLAEDLETQRPDGEKSEFMLGFNCILRALESDKKGVFDELGALVQRQTKSSILFDTYGEQLNGLHMNQTLVAISFSKASGHKAA